MASRSEDDASASDHRPWWRRPIRIHPVAEAMTWAAVAAGAAFRLLAYASNRSLYRDEASLLQNLVRLDVFDFHTTLTEYQLAPPAFLAIERLLVRLPGNVVLTARALPLVFGIASIFLFRIVGRRFLTREAVPIAVGLFALSDWLIYYSSEIKQYSCDLALTLAALLLATGPPVDGCLPIRRLVAMAAFGVVGFWFSYPIVFVLAGVGVYLFTTAIVRRDRRALVALPVIGLLWVVSFGACYLVSHRMLDQGRFIWDWWDFAFLRIPPHSINELKLECWQLLNVFDSPSDVKTPLGPVATAFLALTLAIVGVVAIGRRWPGGLFLMTAPFALVMAASALRQYPFHGRLLIFLVPMVQMLVAQGAATLGRVGGPRFAIVLGAFLLIQPASDAVWHQFVRPLYHDGFDSHGDLRPDLLDEVGAENVELGRSRR